LAITVPWHWLAQRDLPDFAEFFFVHEHVARYLTPSARSRGGLVVLRCRVSGGKHALDRVGACGCWQRLARRAPRGQFDPGLFLWMWVVFIGVFFSLSDSKLMPYLLPAMPALALLIAALPGAHAANAICCSRAILTHAPRRGAGIRPASIGRASSPPRTERILFTAGQAPRTDRVLLTVSGAFVLVQACARRERDARRGISRGGLVSGVAAAGARRRSWSRRSTRGWISPPRCRIATAPRRSTASHVRSIADVLFAANRHAGGYRGELDYGLRNSPEARDSRGRRVSAAWSSQPKGFCRDGEEMFEDFKRRGVPMRFGGANGQSRLGGAPMSWVTWALILTGVGLNAAAQLLLKVATGRWRISRVFSANA
jgi:hypothetical protein